MPGSIAQASQGGTCPGKPCKLPLVTINNFEVTAQTEESRPGSQQQEVAKEEDHQGGEQGEHQGDHLEHQEHLHQQQHGQGRGDQRQDQGAGPKEHQGDDQQQAVLQPPDQEAKGVWEKAVTPAFSR